MMFKQLSYFHTLAEDISDLGHCSQQLNQLLADAYSSTSQPYCTIEAQIDNIIQQEQLLQNTLANIDLQLNSNTFVPERLDELQLAQIEPSQAQLPNWLPFVLDQEYACHRQQLNAYALQLLRMHSLEEKRKALSKQRLNLTGLQARSVELGLKGFEGIDLLEEAAHLRDRIKHVRKAYQYFCTQIARKIVDFVREVMAKSKHFHKNTASPTSKQSFGLHHDQGRAEPRISGGRTERQHKVEYIRAKQPKILDFQQGYQQDLQISKNRDNFYSPQPNLSSHHYHYHQRHPHHHRPPHQHYYGKSQQLRTQTTQPDHKTTTHPYSLVPNDYSIVYNQNWNQDSMQHCQNHQSHRPSKAHQHTCSKKGSNLSRVVSAQKVFVSSSARSKVFDYRSVIRNDYLM